jgi:hypothetical protein
MEDEQPKDTAVATPGRLHRLMHRIPGVPAHDDSRGPSHQGRALRGRHPSLNDTINGKVNHVLDDEAHGRA